TVRSGIIAAGQTVGVLSFHASADARFPAAPIKLVGRGEGPNPPLEQLAAEPVVFAHQTNLPTSTMTQYGLVAAPALATPVTLEPPAMAIEVAHGFGSTIPVKVVRTKGADSELAITALPLAPGLTVPGDKIAAKATEGTVRVQS